MRGVDKRTITEVRQEIRSKIKKGEMKSVETEIMLHINKRLFQQGFITEETYRLAKEDFLRS